MYIHLYMQVLHIIILFYHAVNCCVHFPIKRGMQTVYSLAICKWYPSITTKGKVGWVSIMSLPVLIAKTERKLSANSLCLYKSLSSLCQKWPHTLHRWFTFFAWISIQHCPFLLKNSCLDHRFRKTVNSSVLLCVLMSVITCLAFSISWFLHYARLK